MNRTSIALAVAAAFALAACSKEVTCPAGETACRGVCTSLAIDSLNCGACGAPCGPYQECNAGVCECGAGASSCGPACADLTAAPAHCGSCSTACTGGTACASGACVASCPAGLANCGNSCVDLATDRWACGSCFNSCRRGESCRDGQCRPDLYVACFATDDVRPANSALRAGLPAKSGDGPISLAIAGTRLFAANSLSHSLTSFGLDLRTSAEFLLGGSDFEALAEHGGRLFVANAGTGTLVAWDPASSRVVDEVALGATGVNPRGIGFVGDRAYVALYGATPSSGGQEVVAIDFSGIASCASPPCATVAKRISVAGGADAGGLPFPYSVAVAGTKVYVTISNLKLGALGYYTDPAGDGKLAVIDSAASDALTFVDLGAGCTNPGGLALLGSVLWVSCGGTGNLVPVDLAVTPPGIGAAVSLSGAGVWAPGKLAFCGGNGYVTDQWSGTVVRFDPAGLAAPAGATICPNSDKGWAWAADVLCAP